MAILAGPWRAVPVLGLTQILGWGTMFFPTVLVAPLVASEQGWSISFVMGGFSAAMLVAGLASPRIGASVDRLGGHVVMPAGLAVGALGLALLALADSRVAWILGWVVMGLGMAASLYDTSFATLGRIFGTATRKPITWLALVSGFASTLSWPATHALNASIGWRGTYGLYAALLVLVAVPVAALAIPRTRYSSVETSAGGKASGSGASAPVLRAEGWPFVLLASAFAAYAFAFSGMAAHLLAMFGRLGLDAGTAVALGALVGPSQFTIRLVEIGTGAPFHPLVMARVAVGLLLTAYAVLAFLGVSAVSVAAFMILYGVANGIFTIVRGTVPMALFGPAGYGAVMGRIALPYLFMQALAPIAVAFIAERVSDVAAIVVLASFVAASLACFALVRRP